MIKGSVQEEEIIIVNLYMPNIRALGYMQQMLTHINVEIDGNTIIAGEFNTPLTSMGDPLDRKEIKPQRS